MAHFIYKARNRMGALVTGEVTGDTLFSIKDMLANQGLFPVDVHKKGMDLSVEAFGRKVTQKDLAHMTRQFRVMFAAGLPMDRILHTLRDQADHPTLKKVLEKVFQDVSQGSKLSEAFGKHPQVFSPVYVNMVAVGEAGGVLEKALGALTDLLYKEYRISSQVKSATLYPKIVICALIGVATLMLTIVFPGFADFYSNFDAELPLPTRIVMGASDLMVKYWFLVAGFGVGLVIAWKNYSKTVLGQTHLGYLFLKMPVFGKLNLLVANARFGHLLSALYGAGMPLVTALDVIIGALDNLVYSNEVKKIRNSMDQGTSMSQAMESCSYFPHMVREAVAVGEKTGALDKLLSETATYFDDEITDLLKMLTTLIEPLLLFVIFGFVILLALAVMLPMWNLSNVVLHGGAQ